MAIIRPFEAPELGLRPSEIGVESTAAVGRRVGAFANQLAQETERYGERAGRQFGSAIRDAGQVVTDTITHHQVSQGAATFAELSSTITNDWNTIVGNADPNDPSVAAKFRQTALEPALDKWKQGFATEAGQKWAEAHVEHLRSHMFEKTDADMASLAKQAASNNLHQTLNQLSNTVYNDPSSLKFALDTLGSSAGGIVDSSPNLKGTVRASVKMELTEKGREQIVKSAALGYISKTGQMPPWVSDPDYSKYINGIELKQFQKAAEAQTKTNFLQDKAIEDYRLKQADRAAHAAANKNFSDNVSVDPETGKVIINPNYFQGALDIAKKNPDAPSASTIARTYLDWGEHQQRQRAEPVVSDQTVKSDLLTRLGDADNPTTEMQILDWAARDKLSSRDTTLLREMVKASGPELMRDPLVHAAIGGAEERVGMRLMADGHERYANFLQQFWPEYLRQKRAGTLEPNALDLKDPNSLISKSLKTWEPTPQERLRAALLKNLQSLEPQTGAPVEPKVALPPIDKLEDGKVYETARGKLKWDAKRGVFVTQ